MPEKKQNGNKNGEVKETSGEKKKRQSAQPRGSKPSKTKKTVKKDTARKESTAEKAKKTGEKIPQNKERTQRKNQSSGAQNREFTAWQDKRKKAKSETAQRKKQEEKIRVYFLGGINEVGKNMTVYEYGDDMVIVDCGLAFPDRDMPGIDLVIPDFSFIEKNAGRIKGIVITHGHEDHIGALAYLLKTVNIPVFGTRLTIGLIEGKLEEHRMLSKAKLQTVEPGDEIRLGAFKIEFIHVNHSIPDAVGLAVKTPAGVIIQTGDFKIDCTPIDGGMIDIARFSELGRNGVLALLSDSTNAERPGFTESEKKVGESFELLFRKAGHRRIIVATFASNVHRVQQIMDVAKSLDRKVALSGRSLENVVNIGTKLGYLHVPEDILISIDEINEYTPEQLVLITTGSQGEPMSALTRMAFSDHRKVFISPNDYVIISANPIPGNERTVGNVINELMMLGAEVVYEKMYDVHVSGHACQEELKMMLGICKPKYFIPVHGERKHLQKHAKLAENMGMPKDRIMLVENGSALEISDEAIKMREKVTAGKILVDGTGVGDVGSVVIRDRKILANDGLIIVVATIDSYSGEIISGPDIVSRGFVYVKESEELIENARRVAYNTLIECQRRNIREWNNVKSRVSADVSKLMYEKTKRSPMVLPILMEV